MKFAISMGAVLGLACASALLTPAQAEIGQGVQGRPHGGNAAERFYAYRHGVPYTGRHRRHGYGSTRYGY